MSENVSPAVQEQPAKQMKKPKNKKLRRRIIGGVIAAAVLGGGIFGLVKFLGGGEDEAQILTDVVSFGSITSTVEGSGIAKARDTETINIATAGTVTEVFVAEGDYVEAGTPLYVIDSPAAQTAVDKAREAVTAQEKELNRLYEAAANLTIRAEHAGKLLEVTQFHTGDSISAGQVIATLVDDHTMRLEQYYSYAYESAVYVGQSATVSIPSVMEQLTGKVAEINKVNRISAEGSRLFQVVIEVTNPGTLTSGMAASASIVSGGETIYPYEQGELSYNKETKVEAKVSGKVSYCAMLDYLDVSAGKVLVEITGDENEGEIASAKEALNTATETLAEAEENLGNLEAVAPISGTVIGLAIAPGQEVSAGTTVISIADTSTIAVTAQVDERNIAYVQTGMYVDIDQWGNAFSGYVESVSLTPEYSGGAAMYPATILVDNFEGQMISGGSVTYSLVASQSDGCLVLPIQCVKYVPNEETGETMSVVFLQSEERPENAIDIADTSTIGVPESGFYAVPVETGISDKNNVEIISGVNEGDTVFTQALRQNSWN